MNLFLLPVTVASAYLLMVSVCVTGRMTRRTKHRIRWPVIVLGFLAFWAFLRTVQGDWHPSAFHVAHALIVVIGAVVIAKLPRLST